MYICFFNSKKTKEEEKFFFFFLKKKNTKIKITDYGGGGPQFLPELIKMECTIIFVKATIIQAKK